MLNIFFLRQTCRSWVNAEKYGEFGQVTDDNITRSMDIACWTPKATDTHSEYVILIAFTVQQLLHGNFTILRYKYIACLVPFLPLCDLYQDRCNVRSCLTKVNQSPYAVKYHDSRTVCYFLVSKYLKSWVINMQYTLCSKEMQNSSGSKI